MTENKPIILKNMRRNNKNTINKQQFNEIKSDPPSYNKSYI